MLKCMSGGTFSSFRYIARVRLFCRSSLVVSGKKSEGLCNLDVSGSFSNSLNIHYFSAHLFPSARDLVVPAHKLIDATAEIICSLRTTVDSTDIASVRRSYTEDSSLSHTPSLSFPLLTRPQMVLKQHTSAAFRKHRPISMYTALIYVAKLKGFFSFILHAELRIGFQVFREL